MKKEPVNPNELMCKFAHEILLQKARTHLNRTDKRAQIGVYCVSVWRKDYSDLITLYDIIFSPQNEN